MPDSVQDIPLNNEERTQRPARGSPSNSGNSDRPKSGFFLKLIASVLESIMILWITAVCSKVIQVYNDIEIPVLSWFFVNLHVNDILAFLQALVIVILPVFVFKAVFESELKDDPIYFFYDPVNVVWFTIGTVAICAIFLLELFNLVQEARYGLETLVDCDPNNRFCDQASIDQLREELETQAEIALPLAIMFSGINLVIALGTAYLFQKKTD